MKSMVRLRLSIDMLMADVMLGGKHRMLILMLPILACFAPVYHTKTKDVTPCYIQSDWDNTMGRWLSIVVSPEHNDLLLSSEIESIVEKTAVANLRSYPLRCTATLV